MWLGNIQDLPVNNCGSKILLNLLKIEKIKKLVANLNDKIKYVIHIRNWKQALNNRLVLKKVHWGIRFYQNAKTINLCEQRSEKKKWFWRRFFLKLINNAAFGKHWDIKLVTTERGWNYLVLEQLSEYNVFHRISISNRNEKQMQALMNKFVCLGLSILELIKILMREFCYDYVKPKYVQKVKLHYMDTVLFYTLKRRYLQRYCRRCCN